MSDVSSINIQNPIILRNGTIHSEIIYGGTINSRTNNVFISKKRDQEKVRLLFSQSITLHILIAYAIFILAAFFFITPYFVDYSCHVCVWLVRHYFTEQFMITAFTDGCPFQLEFVMEQLHVIQQRMHGYT